MVGDANLLETGAVGDQRRAVHADDDNNMAGVLFRTLFPHNPEHQHAHRPHDGGARHQPVSVSCPVFNDSSKQPLRDNHTVPRL